ncbi:NAD-dependent epimerase/dehydratase family protein [Streptomyces sp. WAC 00631]|uniref:NAD-dependent epimerase/dehydratase family protein n=1 Tax=unclassified Streptomyces TaxID=2593676 RepID=UPI000F77417D|nr:MULTISPECIES: NAD-dependent epimerase/dehydratase family protein [unclassified Streptomyces]MCC5033682.1 NAD-dependent epimerase/dehydratase family protein [Streptomyces sp. WAC 00631]MCC9742927.1 NAD-dependent epimerase/dehydratase family protein [Streptomyces sp. MNU89]
MTRHTTPPGPPGAAHEARVRGLRVVVTGATGNIGTGLLGLLREDDRVGSVLAIARRPPGTPQERRSAGSGGTDGPERAGDGDGPAGATARDDKITWLRADICRADLVHHFEGADAVVHLAWLFHPSHRPSVTWRTNVLGSTRVFRAAAAAGVAVLVHASSVAAYSPGPKERGVDESWPTHGWPASAYSREKAYVERVLDAFEQDHPAMRVVRLRPGIVFRRESAAQQRRIFAGPLLSRRMVRPSRYPAMPDLPGLRFQTLHTDDAADAFRRAVLTPVRGPFNLAADPPVDARMLARVFGTRTVRVPARPVLAAVAAAWRLHLVPTPDGLLEAVLRMPLMDTTRARTELGWQPRHSAEETVEEFAAGLRRGTGGPTPALAARLPGGGRARELATGVGERT